jgi:hypothetical protein
VGKKKACEVTYVKRRRAKKTPGIALKSIAKSRELAGLKEMKCSVYHILQLGMQNSLCRLGSRIE